MAAIDTIESRQLVSELLELFLVTRKALMPIKAPHADISPLQMMVLVTVEEHRCLNMTQISNEISVSNQQLTKLVKGLLQKGYVRREPDPANRRAMLLSLTQEGVDYLELCHRRFLEAMLPNLQGVSPEQKQRLHTSILELKESIVQISKTKG